MANQQLFGLLKIILRANGTHNSTPCQLNQGVAVGGKKLDAAFRQSAAPKGVIEVPDHQAHVEANMDNYGLIGDDLAVCARYESGNPPRGQMALRRFL
jgi:hypothetical protein